MFTTKEYLSCDYNYVLYYNICNNVSSLQLKQVIKLNIKL